MSSDARAASGAPIPFSWAGKSYTLAPLTLSVYGEISAAIAAKRLDILERVANSLDKLPPRLHEAAIKAAVQQASLVEGVKQEEFQAFITSREGMPLVLSKMLEGAHPDMTPERCAEEFKGVPMRMLEEIILQASGLADAKN